MPKQLKTERLLLVLPLQAQVVEGRVFVDMQACNGLRLWLENFANVTLACPAFACVAPSSDVEPIHQIKGSERLTFVPLPIAYTPHRFAVAMPSTARILSAQIREATYLHFAIGGLWGDWASVACVLAGRRKYAVWTDNVGHRVLALSGASRRGARRLYRQLTARLLASYERFVVRRAALGLFHGADCFDFYAPHCRNSHLVHDIHSGEENLIAPDKLHERLARRERLRIVYAGRVHWHKGVFDWIEALAYVAARGFDFEAVWFGEGPSLDEARRKVEALGLGQITFPGALDHDLLMEELKRKDLFAFCHKIPESPRCLIEALQCGLPIVGYESAYPLDLIHNGGGVLTPANDPLALAKELTKLAGNRPRLTILSERAARDGAMFSPECAFRHRSELMKSLGA